MSENVYWILELELKPGQLEPFKALMEEMVTATQADEPGALNYEWSISANKNFVTLYERYADSAAVMVHLGNFNKKFAKRFMDAANIKRFTFFGAADAQVVGALTGIGAVQMTPWGGFSR